MSLLEPVSMTAKLDIYTETEDSITEYKVEAIVAAGQGSERFLNGCGQSKCRKARLD